MAFSNINTKTTLEAQIVSDNRTVCDMYATVESTGAFSLTFNVSDEAGWYAHQANNLEDAKALLENVHHAARNQFEAQKNSRVEKEE